MRTRLKPGEQLVLVTRKHWFALVPSFIFAVILIGGAALIGEIGALALVFPVLAVLFLIFKIMAHRCNLWAVTTQRMIAEEGFLSISAKVSPLDKINNVSYHQSLFGRIFGYGNVQIQTAASMGSTTFRFVSEPQQLIDAIMQYQANSLAAMEFEGQSVALPVTQKTAVKTTQQAGMKPVEPLNMIGGSGRISTDSTVNATAERHIISAIETRGTEAKSGYRTRSCPYCSEIISVNAGLCRFCGKDL